MNKTIIAIVIVGVVLVGGYFLFKGIYQPTPITQTSNQQTIPQPSASEPTTQQPTSQPSAGQAPAVEEKVVTYTNAGFSPTTLRIKKGETVSFKNEELESMWVASNPHPIHTDYSGFDAKRGYSKGESYLFSFTKSGTWKYHNHLNPGEGGVIIVE